MADPFSPQLVAKTISELRGYPTKRIKETLKRIEGMGLSDLSAACDAELARRPMEYDKDTATRMLEAEKAVESFDLPQATRYAFKALPASPAEEIIIPWLVANPGGAASDLKAIYGKGDLGLAIGFLVYDRMGCFSKFVTDESDDKSAVLIERDRSGPSVRYTLKPEVIPVFQELGLA
ncbi:hypothetical protein [Aureimonas sp. AU20]|uniref:hypothetical protein n=1 Tax=Aureimonas sp. AU20 TaxID=1349819 RepID=UPI000720CCB1|nr:hypothetical protein [Aureimonas sp. AU20]ALN75827.1 hypothetical protein M673_24040 [Aureimonas sp. AU20]